MLSASITNISKAPTCSSGLIRNSSAAPHVIKIFPNEQSCLPLIRALAVEIHEDWIEAHRYLNMETLREQRKELHCWRPPKVNATAYLTNRLLWLSASAGALSLRGSGCRNLASGVYE
jgi:hypothetical protein